MIDVIIDCFQYFRNQLFAQPFPFFINIDVTATGEIDTFEGTSLIFARLIDLHGAHLAGLVDKHGLSGLQLPDGAGRDIKGCLYHGTFTGKAPLTFVGLDTRRLYGCPTGRVRQKSLRFR